MSTFHPNLKILYYTNLTDDCDSIVSPYHALEYDKIYYIEYADHPAKRIRAKPKSKVKEVLANLKMKKYFTIKSRYI